MQIETDPGGRYDVHAYHRGIDGGPRWELSLEVECKCGSTDVSIRHDLDMITLVCSDCPNWWIGYEAELFIIDQDTGEIRLSSWNIPFSFDGRPNRY